MSKTIYKKGLIIIILALGLCIGAGSAHAYYGGMLGTYGMYGGLYGGMYGMYGMGMYGMYGGMLGMYGGMYGMYGGLYGMYGGMYGMYGMGMYGLNSMFNLYNMYYPIDTGSGVTYQVPFLQIAPLLGMAGMYRSLFSGLLGEEGVQIAQ